jgi:hypothetical protein
MFISLISKNKVIIRGFGLGAIKKKKKITAYVR